GDYVPVKYWQGGSKIVRRTEMVYTFLQERDDMEQYIGDLGIVFAAALVILYLMWGRLFPH
ncbi:MAG TPA: hypothetical protein VN521_02135, partial [Negativicutes bacterium]|nr:hypothetical protein [Negativicutes bacterium]